MNSKQKYRSFVMSRNALRPALSWCYETRGFDWLVCVSAMFLRCYSDLLRSNARNVARVN